ncbi:Insecticidal toxin complex protein TccB1 [hydrothermal vent metagenome]|uniref:Insecticidal toxin complex protein TccB1 n=1 Tax=hydrothermal vent metagenome TaxID=652676 RepID=A0A3B1AUE9_9ZZZZ
MVGVQVCMEHNKRRLEITKNISLVMLNPMDLIQLRETGECIFSIPEIIFDMDFPGHYQRRIKSVSLSIPCVTGPYTSVSATLRLENSQWRREASLERDLDISFDGASSIATSNAQSDSGLFEFNFRDERYLPFEGAGAISQWKLELPTAVRPFDYNSISDVILHIQYTAKEGDSTFKDNVTGNITTAINSWIDGMGDAAPLTRAFSLRQEFPAEFNRFLQPVGAGNNETLLDIKRKHFPHFIQHKDLTLKDGALLIFKTREGEFFAETTMQLGSALPMESPIISDVIADDSSINNLPVARFSVTGSPIRKWAFSIPELPEDIEDVFFVVYYQIG